MTEYILLAVIYFSNNTHSRLAPATGFYSLSACEQAGRNLHRRMMATGLVISVEWRCRRR